MDTHTEEDTPQGISLTGILILTAFLYSLYKYITNRTHHQTHTNTNTTTPSPTEGTTVSPAGGDGYRLSEGGERLNDLDIRERRLSSLTSQMVSVPPTEQGDSEQKEDEGQDVKPTKVIKTPEEIDSFMISKIFQVSLKPEETYRGVPLYYLAHLAEDVEGELLSEKLIDSIISDRIIDIHSDLDKFNYLIACLDRAMNVKPENEISTASKRSIISFTGLILSGFDMQSPLYKYLMGEQKSEVVKCLLDSLSKQFEQIELEQIILPVIYDTFQTVLNSGDSVNFQALRCLNRLVEHERIVSIIVNLSEWSVQPNMTGREIERLTILGSFFACSGFRSPTVSNASFTQDRYTKQQLASIFNMLRMEQNIFVNGLGGLFHNLFRYDEPKLLTLRWLASVGNHNLDRVKMGFLLQPEDSKMTSSDGFFFNICSSLVYLMHNFTSRDSYDIDPSWLLPGNKNTYSITFEGETPLYPVSEEEIGLFQAPSNPSENFSSLFFITILQLHVGLNSIIQYYKKMTQNLSRVLEQIEQISATSNPFMQTQISIARQRSMVMVKEKLNMDAYLRNDSFLNDTLSFYSYVAKWLTSLVVEHEGNQRILLNVPEFFLQDISEFLLFIATGTSNTTLPDEMVDFLVLFVESSTLVKNPYLRSQLAEILYHCCPVSLEEKKMERLSLVCNFEDHPVSQKNLVKALIQLYVDIEETGRDGEFYEKYFIRRHITLLLKYLQGLKQYKTSIFDCHESNPKLFVYFINMLLNDLIYLTTEVISKLKEIKQIQSEIRGGMVNQTPDVRAERMQTLQQNERYVETFNMLSNETILLLKYLTDIHVTTFFRPEMIGRIAETLNYFLENLVGPKKDDISVSDSEKYKFRPGHLLQCLILMYINLFEQGENEFIEAVLNDGRLPNLSYFETALEMVRSQFPDDLCNRYLQFLSFFV
eukprot:TRINITY_DN2657_c0_g1_i2.p1 TRINITY_DN2657_c0_g1~~TRINITY_DN2657_c0_g1_i2.p1  ORF type:complete len:933 (-),score=170.70 TRINITY_DN2657_c0_g1_i2:327-3125(-)